jgi:hypothetical protein
MVIVEQVDAGDKPVADLKIERSPNDGNDAAS